MKAAVLCPPPSVHAYAQAGFYDLVIAVNRAVLFYPADIWAAGDHDLIEETDTLNARELWSSADGVLKVRTNRPERVVGRRVCEFESAFEYCPHAVNWCTFTATAALVRAGWAGATKIDVFGAEWTSRGDADGVQRAKNRRDDERWDQESVIWANVVEWLKGRGVVVERINGIL